MALLKPITFHPSSPKQKSAFPMAPAPAPAPQPTPASNPSFRSIEPKIPPAQPHLSITPGIGSLSRSDPPTPPRGPPPTPKRRPHNELSKADPPTPPRGPPPTPGRREVSFRAPDSLSRRDPPTPPRGPPPTPARRAHGVVVEDSDIFSSLSREDPPTPPSAPPPTPTGARRATHRGLSKCDPPTPPSAPPPSPQGCRAGIYSEYSRSDPPTPPSAPPPTPGRSVPWTTQEINLLVSVCRSGVKLGWCQIAGLFRGRSVLECRNKYQDVIHGRPEAIDLEPGCYDSDCEHSLLGLGGGVFDDNSRSIRRKCLSIPTEGDDLVPELIASTSPVGSPAADRRVITKRKRNWRQIGDVETADEGTIHHHSHGDNSSDKHCYSSKRAKTITHLSDELNFVLSQEWFSNVQVIDRIQEHHAMSQHAREGDWSPPSTSGFEFVLGNQL
ncbi:unnamed protein product [Tuber aestivum]|uniref:Myb-like domain-containing protein n=1 Tax=Tuber aestivum TaxID=59557 RepID=A0A292PP65_9PEZI|nr:unnamed protein product [Tuber aestivum]